VETPGPVEIRNIEPVEIPDIPVGILGALGGLTPPPGQDRGTEPENREEPFPVATPVDAGVPLPVADTSANDPAVELGQPADDGGLPVPTGEEFADLPDEEFWR
jgi:hypothetical protein